MNTFLLRGALHTTYKGASITVMDIYFLIHVSTRVFKSVHHFQGEAGLAGSLSVLSGGITSLTVGKFADVVGKRMKLFILGLFVTATAMFLVFSLMAQGYIPFSNGNYLTS